MKKRSLIVSGIALLVVFLAGAAFVGGRLLNGQGLSGVPGTFLSSEGGRGVRINVDYIQPAKELPQTPADVRGLFDRRQDNSLFVGTGRVEINVEQDPSGKVKSSSSHSGPTVEVVVSAQTTIYKDVTMRQYKGQPPSGQKIQQVVEPGSLDEIGQNSVITAWGRKTGDRFLADVLVYKPDSLE